MAEKAALVSFLRDLGARNHEITDFLDVCDLYTDMGKAGRYEVYRLWARCLRHRRTHFSPTGKFTFPEPLYTYMRHISAGDIVDADPPANAVLVSGRNFVEFVVKHIDDAF